MEKYGFIGNKNFVQKIPTYGSGEKSGMISLEMLGFQNLTPCSQNNHLYIYTVKYPDRGDFIAIVGNEPSQEIAYKLTDAIRKHVPNLPSELLVVPGSGDIFQEIRLSDHSPFWDKGHRAIMVTDTAFFKNSHYDHPTDSIETLDLDFITDVSIGVTEFLKQFLS